MYKRKKLYLFCILILMTIIAHTQSLKDNHPLTVCPSDSDKIEFVNFEHDSCIKIKFYQLNPQNKQLWIKIDFKIYEDLLSQDQPLGLYIYGKASSKVFINGQLLGNNGSPNSNPELEVPGNMDTVFYIDKSTLSTDNNQLIMQMSSHHGYLNLFSPISSILINKYRLPTNLILRHYWTSFLPFGVFILAALYLSIWSFSHPDKISVIFLLSMSLCAATQLLIETMRGTIAYLYPFHDVRLLLILIFSVGFGISLFSHIAIKFSRNYKRLIFTSLLITFICISFSQGFDMMSAIAIVLPALQIGTLCLYWSYKRKKHASLFAISTLLFSLLFIISPSLFLDRYFYYVVAGLMLFLFVRQAIDFSQERNIRISEKARADKLQLIIDQNHETSNPGDLNVKGAGTIKRLAINTIAYIKGAGDYVEIVLLDKSSVLHNGSLRDLENSLPITFLKVHRSYIVNTAQINSLERGSSGTGKLILENKEIIPVSRRIMPEVRKNLI